MWVAVGDNFSVSDTIAYSYDGMNWTGLGSTTFSPYGFGIAWNGSLWVAGGGNPDRIAISYDGLTWTSSTSGNTVFPNGTACNVLASRRVLPYVGTSVIPPPQKPLTENFMVAGGSGTNELAYSYDGLTWTPSTSGNTAQSTPTNAVAWNGSMWVAVGGGSVYSSDGINWTAATPLITPALAVAWGGSLWVVAGNDTNKLGYSYDGINWTGSTSGNTIFTGGTCNAVAWNGRIWVAGGVATNTTAYSYDGINWNASASGTAILDTGVTCVAWNGTTWFAGGYSSNAGATKVGMYSSDGITWTEASSLAGFMTNGCNSIATNGSLWIAGGNLDDTNLGVMGRSLDGITWTETTVSSLFTGPITSISWNGSVWVATCAGASRMGFSYDGINWFPSTGASLFSTYGIAVAARRVLPYVGYNIQGGPTGATGPTGDTGPTGSTGDTGPVASDALEWTTYSPSWTASTTNPDIGDGTITGRYKAIGKTVFVSVKINMGTTTTYGSGQWRVSLPVDAFSASSAILPSVFLDNGNNWFQGTSYTEYGGATSYVVPVWNRGLTGSAPADFATPFTWGSTDSFSFAGSYESV
jgi:hypothetical protein